MREYSLPDPLVTLAGQQVRTADAWQSHAPTGVDETVCRTSVWRDSRKSLKQVERSKVVERDARGTRMVQRGAVRFAFVLVTESDDNAPMIRVLRYVPANAERASADSVVS